jgi:Tol biopolymer transport system component
VIDVESKKASEIAKNDWVVSDPQFSPDGKRLSFTVNPTPKADDGQISDIYIANVDGSGAPRKLHENDGPDNAARWSPDGKWIAFASRPAKKGLLGFANLYIISAEGGAPRLVAPNHDAPAPAVTWSRDGSTLYFSEIQRSLSGRRGEDDFFRRRCHRRSIVRAQRGQSCFRARRHSTSG